MGHRPSARLTGTVLFGFLITACGGGGGGGDPGYSNASLNGRYYGGHFNLNTGGTESAFHATTSDGNGQVTVNVTHDRVDNSIGSIFSDSADGTYSVQSDGSMSSGLSTDRGMVGAGGDTLLSARVDSTTVHNLTFGFKAGTGHTLAKLQGDYHGVGLRCGRTYDATAKTYGDCAWLNERNTVHFDGLGNYSAYSWDPGMADPAAPYNDIGVYSINDDGTGTTSGGDYVARKTWFSADGSLLIQVGVDDPIEQRLYVGMRKGSSYSHSTLSGTYAFSALTRGTTWVQSAVGTITFDGAGGFTVQELFSDLGVVEKSMSGAGIYTLGTDGLVKFGSMQGVVSADGGTLAVVRWDTAAHGILVATKQ